MLFAVLDVLDHIQKQHLIVDGLTTLPNHHPRVSDSRRAHPHPNLLSLSSLNFALPEIPELPLDGTVVRVLQLQNPELVNKFLVTGVDVC